MAEEQQAQSKMLQVLDYSYEKALNGLPGCDTAQKLAEDYLQKEGTLIQNANSLVNWQISKTATSGFLSGLGGVITLPVAIPANVASVLYVQMRMIAAIAHMGGYDIKSDQVKGLVYVCMAGSQAKDILKNIGIQFGTKFSKSLIQRYVTGAALTKINQAVGFRLVTKFGTKGVVNLGKAIPLFGGIVGGSFDAITTKKIGNVACNLFVVPEEEISTDEIVLIDELKNVQEDENVNKIIDLEIQKFFSYINLIKIDGKTTDDEVELLETLVNESDLSEEQKMEIIGKLGNGSMIDVDYSQWKDNIEQGINLINNLFALSKSDGQVHPTEKMFIKNVGRQLGIPDEDIMELINNNDQPQLAIAS
jgi:uncharacterized tellurite resistance protein B-like protein